MHSTLLNQLDIAHRRLANLRLSGPPLDTSEAVVRWLGAVQAQEYSGGKWSIAQRTPTLRDADLDQQFNTGALLRTHILRPTWHFVSPADIRWMLMLTGPRVHATNAYYYRQCGLDPATLAGSEAVLERILRGGQQLTRKQVETVLDREGLAAHGVRLAFVLMHAELNGTICSGALRGKQHTYALLEERVPFAEATSRDTALVELTKRYFNSHGPATTQDYRWWSSLSATDIKRALGMLGAQLASETIDGATYWFNPSLPFERTASPSVHLLQGFDECFVGYSGRSKAVLDVMRAADTHVDGQASVWPYVVVLDAQVIGRLRRRLGRADVVIETDIRVPLNDAARAAVQRAIERFAAFLNLPIGPTGRLPRTSQVM
jgi:hypothetical protein